MTAKETVLVTGSSGFIGSHLVELLSTSGRYHVIAADAQRSARSASFAALPDVEVCELDLRDRAAMEAVVSRCQSIVHLAALRPAAASARPRAAFEVNVVAAYDLIELATQHGIRRIVFGSSHSVYGAFRERRTFRHREHETAEGCGLGMYGASKLAVEAYLEAHANNGGPEFLSLRFGTIYGPRVNRDNSLGGMMMDAIDAVRAGGRPEVRWAPDALHDLVYVADAAKTIVEALHVRTDEKAINIVGEPVTTTELFGTLVRTAGGAPSTIDWKPEQVRYQQVSQDRMFAVFGRILETGMTDGLRAFVEWHLSGDLVTPTAR
ncbi:NAD(P)-dependent oxidoreductase [Streptomyces sp. NBC_01795]|uniref:NAD-dependent epimerase/dehydratase family protein n=1 Tax=Streptomyces sp. NBC_01795 TaxID=2975943 RepID=UPI002DD99369|nr:NAD(P)-dependent oxidoreductase [Streptomyces sp. NBC_01795]WSA90608.1 NAD(P)-dependent oxidoreductase [Streptomyces sp. NBC_01795]